MKSRRYIAAVSILTAVFLFTQTCVYAQEEIPQIVDMVPVSKEPGQLYAMSAVLMDGDSGRVLYEKDGTKARANASTTKVLTCIVALESAPGDDYVQVSEKAASQPEVKLGLKKGEQYHLEDLLYSLMLKSHNDAAVAIAEHCGGSVEGFARMLNRKAEQIGCKDTHFITPNGLDAEDENGTHHTTAEDLALIMRYAIKNKTFLHIAQTRDYNFSDITGKRNFFLHNANALLDMMDGVLAGKTGFTSQAGYCYVCAWEKDGRIFIVSLLGCGWPNHKTYKWRDTKALMTYGLENYEFHRLSEVLYNENLLDPIPVTGGQTDHIGGTAYTALSIHRCDKASDPDTGMLLSHQEAFVPMLSLDRSQSAPLVAGTQVGKIDYLVGDQVIYTESIVTVSSVPAIDLSWCLHQILSHYLLPCA